MSPAGGDDGKRGGLLSGWSRRKLAARRQAEAEEAETEDAQLQETDIAPADAEPDLSDEPDGDEAVDEELIASLPSIEDITGKTDLAPFMQRGVPLAMRNAALRKVWTLNPLIRDHVDPALDYAWDWNAPGGVPGGGGTLTGEGVSQMVRNLIGDAKPADVAKSALRTGDDPPSDDAPADADEPTEQMPDDEPQPVRRGDTSGTGSPDTQSPDADPRPETDEGESEQMRVKMTLPLARRHGGALPE